MLFIVYSHQMFLLQAEAHVPLALSIAPRPPPPPPPLTSLALRKGKQHQRRACPSDLFPPAFLSCSHNTGASHPTQINKGVGEQAFALTFFFPLFKGDPSRQPNRMHRS
ncbi:hypothetical protein RRG08_015875 [Elysia crispata]|uniref:Uncharacterized protein n=1 Tax=Elysia crispata TaxID=231223 RepID=A0AAE0YMM9_9GAST|nr:hypothetical protein RRG08_015875 [Elysia crispata]